jgi:hypothetical protein
MVNTPVSQVLERLPNGEYAWLQSKERAELDDALYVPTQAGRDLVARWRAQEALFGPCPRVEASRTCVDAVPVSELQVTETQSAPHRDSTVEVNCFTSSPTKRCEAAEDGLRSDQKRRTSSDP